MRVERIGDATLYLGDCRDINLPRDDAAIVSDPPYGIRYSPGGGGNGWTKGRKTFAAKDIVIGDDGPFDPTPWLDWPEVILWGANHYASSLPAKPGWLVWDKRQDGLTNDFADCEMAWTNLKQQARVFRHLWCGAFRASEKFEERVHPTQKPVALMAWCLGFIKAQTIVDPYAGSGTTGVAAARAGRPFVGVEIDPAHFETACCRIEAAYRQPRLFDPPPPPKPQQEAML